MSGILTDANKTYNDDQSATADIINDGVGVQTNLNVGTSAVEARVGGARLEGRKSLTVFNNGNGTIYWGYTNAVTTSTGTPIFKNQQVEFSVGDGQAIYLIAGGATNDTRITEGA